MHGEARSGIERCEGANIGEVVNCVATSVKGLNLSVQSIDLLDIDGNPANEDNARMIRVVAKDPEGVTHIFLAAIVRYANKIKPVWIQGAVVET